MGRRARLACGGGSPGGGFDVKLVFWDIKTGRIARSGCTVWPRPRKSPSRRMAGWRRSVLLTRTAYRVIWASSFMKSPPAGCSGKSGPAAREPPRGPIAILERQPNAHGGPGCRRQSLARDHRQDAGKLAGNDALVTSLALAPDGRSLLTGASIRRSSTGIDRSAQADADAAAIERHGAVGLLGRPGGSESPSTPTPPSTDSRRRNRRSPFSSKSCGPSRGRATPRLPSK